MIPITKPNFDVEELFEVCVSTVNNVQHRLKLSACMPYLISAESEFNNRFQANEIYLIKPNTIVYGNIDKDKMKRVYDYRMVQCEDGKVYYDKIFDSAPDGICPLCSVREVDTLDHYLPKMKFPVFAVTPINLIPACFKCNRGKLVSFPKSAENQTLHPYYDNIDEDHWLRAKLIQGNPIGFHFYVEKQSKWDDVKFARVKNHLESFNLNALFSAKASRELRGASLQLKGLFEQSPSLLIDHLVEAYKSRIKLGKNSWEYAMYFELANNHWFCMDGVTQ